MLLSARFSTNREKVLIAGLGNPGDKYVNTRHNIGFQMVESVGSYYGINIKKLKCRALIGEGVIGGKSVILAKPQTYMNLSGESIGALSEYYKIPPGNVIVIYDDISLDTARIRIRQTGSAGGHNGMKSIITSLDTEKFPRIRIGIGKNTGDLSDYVLGNFSKSEVSELIEVAKKMPDIVEDILTKGISDAMNIYNR